MPVSLHSHSGQFCRHASGTLEEVVLEAIRQSFLVYGLTEHVPRYRIEDRYPEEEGLTLEELKEQFDKFIEEAHRLKEVYASRITLLVGAETEFISDIDVSELDELLKQYEGRIEYLVGSVHHVNEVPIDFDKATFDRALQTFPPTSNDDKAQMTQFLHSYLDGQYSLMTRFKPEVIGHMDLCRLYNPHLRFKDFPGVWEKLERNITFATSYGALIELNTAAFRKGWDTSYPGTDITELILRVGGRFTLSDDSHGPHAVGLNYHRLYSYLIETKIPELWYLKRGAFTQPKGSGRCLVAARIEGDWWHHPFWKSVDQINQSDDA